MGTTTTIRLDDGLKDRVADAAERAGTSSHAFIVDAIAQRVEAAEEEQAFHAEAERRWRRYKKDGLAVPFEEAAAYFAARAAGLSTKRPVPRKLGR